MLERSQKSKLKTHQFVDSSMDATDHSLLDLREDKSMFIMSIIREDSRERKMSKRKLLQQIVEKLSKNNKKERRVE
jgi:hypothetical protein